MVGQRLTPGMEDGHAANPGPQTAWIGGKTRHCRAGSPEQDCIDDGLVLERHCGNGSGHGEDDVKTGNRQQFGLARCQPGLPRRTLAFWAMAVAARVAGHACCTAIIAGLDMAAERLRAASKDGTHHPLFDSAKVSGMGTGKSFAMAAQDIGHLDAGAGWRQAGSGHGLGPGTRLSRRRHHLQ